MAHLLLKPNREKSLWRKHPWVFSGAIERVVGEPQAGETVRVLTTTGQFLAYAAYSPHSQIRARVWSFNEADEINADFFEKRIKQALARRATFGLDSVTDAVRIIHAESDNLPGLVVDQYGDVLVLQSLTAGCEFWKQTIADILMKETGCKAIYERSDADVRELEGLPTIKGWLRGEAIATNLIIQEFQQKFKVNFETGHKTGFYLDQRFNRQRVAELTTGKDVLNCFCYTGGFSIHAAALGAKSVLSIDSSADALALAAENAVLNGISSENMEWLEADVFTTLRKFRDQNRSWDVIILDPPKFAPTAAQAEKASRGYKDINRLAFKLLRPGGFLATFSCSGGVDLALFQKIVASAALDAGVEAVILEYFAQAPDHPVALSFPEGAYLKGLLCQRLA